MIPIKDFLNKIKWDSNLSEEDYTIYYFDRIENKLLELRYKDIKRLEGNFIITNINNKEINVPLHRIRKVEKEGVVVWQR
ncbi:MAG: DUF504 domain-containing protein [Nanoarchaeota archaeon]|nr:DUF504 domain-containing protein [DPANN group archaeon]MBL7116299.1 DUF504 domain-containing protein [Nanoarchaeota archaeon]